GAVPHAAGLAELFSVRKRGSAQLRQPRQRLLDVHAAAYLAISRLKPPPRSRQRVCPFAGKEKACVGEGAGLK
ncbi:MAG: hypothetical protein KBT08_10060, partial [Bacteroidales bacterium]|nr:hypothetical protein [Candidatus Cryptobacteroides onthequi]